MGTRLKKEFVDQIVNVVLEKVRERRGDRRGSVRHLPNFRLRWAIANEDIAAPSNGVTSPTTGEVEILTRDTSTDELERSGNMVDIVHRFEGFDIDKDTLLLVGRVNGELIAVGIDCSPLSSPPT